MRNDILCNSCGFSCWLGEDGNGGGNCGLLDAAPMGGYESTPGNGHGTLDDMTEYRFSLCEFCLDALFCDFVISPIVTDWQKDLADPIDHDVSSSFAGALDRIVARKSQNWVDLVQITHLETVTRFVRERDRRAVARSGPKRLLKYEFTRTEKAVIVGRALDHLPRPEGEGWRHLQTCRYVEWEMESGETRRVRCADWRDTSGDLVVCWWYRVAS